LLDRDLREIKDLIESAKKKGISLEKEISLKDLIQRLDSRRGGEAEKEGKNIKVSDIKRNFFAHSGLEKTLTYVKVNENDKIELFYSLDRKSEILSWIKNPDD
jgi:CRISPR/Cas system-associated protein Csx1